MAEAPIVATLLARWLVNLIGGIFIGCTALVAGCSGRVRPSAGFWYESGNVKLDADSTSKLGGPVRAEDMQQIEQISRAELARAFSGLNIDFTNRRDAHWRVSVVSTVPVAGGSPAAGGSVQLGALGGRGSVAFVTLATIAIRYAPEGATRREMLEGIGRGIGCAAAHELAHQILGKAMRDDETDVDGYEYFSADRKSQYFGTLHWTISRPLLQQKLSK